MTTDSRGCGHQLLSSSSADEGAKEVPSSIATRSGSFRASSACLCFPRSSSPPSTANPSRRQTSRRHSRPLVGALAVAFLTAARPLLLGLGVSVPSAEAYAVVRSPSPRRCQSSTVTLSARAIKGGKSVSAGASHDSEEDVDPNDPRAFRSKLRRRDSERRRDVYAVTRGDGGESEGREKQQQRKDILEKINKRRQGEAASASMDLPEQPLIKTIGGGTAMIFAMARQMAMDNADAVDVAPPTLPRYRPTPGISDVNPEFRTKSPVMSSQGYAGTIWRNVRKRNKPSMWRYSLRMYDRMVSSEQQQEEDDEGRRTNSPALRVERTNIHHEGALVACAKLGLWERALEIYTSLAEQGEDRGQTSHQKQQKEATAPPRQSDPSSVYVTDNMVMSVVRACVRGARQACRDTSSLKERRAPLDAAVAVLRGIADGRHGSLPLVSHHVNPVAAGYQSLGLHKDASELVQSLLTDREPGPEDEDGTDRFGVNVNNLSSKDKASYSLLVNGAVSDGDWGNAVDALRDMTEAGLYPNARHLNAWTEVSERKTRHRATRSWTKKREEYWMESV